MLNINVSFFVADDGALSQHQPHHRIANQASYLHIGQSLIQQFLLLYYCIYLVPQFLSLLQQRVRPTYPLFDRLHNCREREQLRRLHVVLRGNRH